MIFLWFVLQSLYLIITFANNLSYNTYCTFNIATLLAFGSWSVITKLFFTYITIWQFLIEETSAFINIFFLSLPWCPSEFIMLWVFCALLCFIIFFRFFLLSFWSFSPAICAGLAHEVHPHSPLTDCDCPYMADLLSSSIFSKLHRKCLASLNVKLGVGQIHFYLYFLIVF